MAHRSIRAQPSSFPSAEELLHRLKAGAGKSRGRTPQKLDRSSIGQVAKEVVRQAGQDLALPSIYPVLTTLWTSGRPQAPALALDLLQGFRHQFDSSTWKLADRWIDGLHSVSLTDALASMVLTPILAEERSHLSRLIRWARSRNPWRRRTALRALHGLSLARKAFIPETLVLARLLVRDCAAPVQEALAQALNHCARLAPSTVRQFLLLYREEMQEDVRREASSGLPTSGV